MNNNINIAKILKNCPRGTKFYSTVHGEIFFKEIVDWAPKPLHFITRHTIGVERFTAEGRLFYDEDTECILFPSKDQRDWSKFTAPWYNKLVKPKFKVGDKIVFALTKYMGGSRAIGTISEITDDKYIFTDGSCMLISNQNNWTLDQDRFDPKTLKPFDRVLARHGLEYVWECTWYSHFVNYTFDYYYMCAGLHYSYCIPYNDDTKHLVGTTEEAPEFYRYWED